MGRESLRRLLPAALNQYVAIHGDEFGEHFAQIKPMFVTKEGHSITVDGKRLMVYAAPTATTCEYWYVAEGKMVMPESLLELTFNNGIALSSLWKNAK